MRAMIVKEFRQMLRNRRMVGLMFGLPLMLLIVFGYAARFDVTSIDTLVAGPGAETAAADLPAVYHVVEIDTTAVTSDAEDALRNSEVHAAVVVGADASGASALLLDGTELFTTQSALRQVPPGAVPQVLFNPDLDTATIMVPSLIGLILLFVGTVVTSLGVVREREQGTLEQLAVMPLRPIDVTAGKIVPYFVVAVVDLVVITLAGIWLFGVPFVGSPLLFAVFALVFLLVVLALGVAISSVSASQGEAVQLAIMTLLPQVMLSGMIFPLESMAAGVRWIGYLLPLTWFIRGMRGILLKGSDVAALAVPLAVLVVMAIVVVSVALARFRRDLAPKRTAEPSATAREEAVA